MTILGKQRLFKFLKRHTTATGTVSAWMKEVQSAEWQTTHDIKERYASASFLADNVVIFNLKGKHYRIKTKVAYKNQVVVVIKIGTHSDYDDW